MAITTAISDFFHSIYEFFASIVGAIFGVIQHVLNLITETIGGALNIATSSSMYLPCGVSSPSKEARSLTKNGSYLEALGGRRCVAGDLWATRTAISSFGHQGQEDELILRRDISISSAMYTNNESI